MEIDRGEGVIKTTYNGVEYRSRTEARWAVFFDHLGVTFKYEPQRFTLSDSKWYLPDFWVEDWQCFIEVKPDVDKIVTEEAAKARLLQKDEPKLNVWLAMGSPDPEKSAIIPLKRWKPDVGIAVILGEPTNRFRILEDRRDSQIYWLVAEYELNTAKEGFVVGGPGTSTDHTREPLLHATVKKAYDAAKGERFK